MDENRPFLKKLVSSAVIAVIGAAACMIIMSCCNPGREPKGTVTMPDIKVYIRGEINSPGLYEIGADTRLWELMKIAGGATENADIDRLNLAAILMDGTTLVIPAAGSDTVIDPMIAVTNQTQYETGAQASQMTTASEKITSGTININTAPKEELMRLPGVGQATADKIINYRNSSGGFKQIEEIMNVSGIGEKTFEKMKQFITVE